MTTEFLLVHTTFPDRTEALEIGRTLVEEKLVACFSIDTHPSISLYSWQGKIEQSGEFSTRIKTHADRFEALSERLTALHPYNVPEILATSVTQGSAAYQDWMKSSLEA